MRPNGRNWSRSWISSPSSISIQTGEDIQHKVCHRPDQVLRTLGSRAGRSSGTPQTLPAADPDSPGSARQLRAKAGRVPGLCSLGDVSTSTRFLLVRADGDSGRRRYPDCRGIAPLVRRQPVSRPASSAMTTRCPAALAQKSAIASRRRTCAKFTATQLEVVHWPPHRRCRPAPGRPGPSGGDRLSLPRRPGSVRERPATSFRCRGSARAAASITVGSWHRCPSRSRRKPAMSAREGRGSPAGVTLIEQLVFIIVVSVGVIGLLSTLPRAALFGRSPVKEAAIGCRRSTARRNLHQPRPYMRPDDANASTPPIGDQPHLRGDRSGQWRRHLGAGARRPEPRTGSGRCSTTWPITPVITRTGDRPQRANALAVFGQTSR